MAGLFDIFEPSTEGRASAYVRIGYPRNPFREPSTELDGVGLPFYVDHIRSQIDEIRRWLREVHKDDLRQPLSLVGSVGAGKTRIIRLLRQSINEWPDRERAATDLVLLSETGYSRASVGGMILASLERMDAPWMPTAPQGVLPIVWAVVQGSKGELPGRGPLPDALNEAKTANGSEKEELARLVSQWLRRAYLTPSQSNRVGLVRRIDWEGELIPILSQLFRIARDVGELHTYFLFVDQLEDLFRPTYSELRRARILTDLRGLVDEIDANATPIGLLLAWSPELGSDYIRSRVDVEVLFRDRYDALYTRLQRRKVVIPLLRRADAVPFAEEWVKVLKEEKGYDHRKQPLLKDLVEAAWTRLRDMGSLQGGNSVTPRNLLSALAEEVDERAGLK